MNFKNFLLQVAEIYKFISRFFKEALFPPYEGREILRQCFSVGNKSLFLITFTGFIAGIVFTKQSSPSLSSFGALFLASFPCIASGNSFLRTINNRLDLRWKIRL